MQNHIEYGYNVEYIIERVDYGIIYGLKTNMELNIKFLEDINQ